MHMTPPLGFRGQGLTPRATTLQDPGLLGAGTREVQREEDKVLNFGCPPLSQRAEEEWSHAFDCACTRSCLHEVMGAQSTVPQ